MYYKTNWAWRLAHEKTKLQAKYPGYQVLSSSSERQKVYSAEEIEQITMYKKVDSLIGKLPAGSSVHTDCGN
ncbi:hypothetical protein J2S00_002708 [Caldalkalibacillus uzonensis]|uniref:Uncharacterized protein n=1 Tax=Caldalkalibacillus uzonensis TaxID=353224 RepID=A0ABU0CU08_9BACI|nr:hypothetical protein [Caldalkalibacillus uzonensis]MDQ0339913.1 hypothetical protein [Caldalkalibacillus uzonensis]